MAYLIIRFHDLGSKMNSKIDNKVDDFDNSILNNFVFILISISNKKRAVTDVLVQLQTDTTSVM